MPVSFSPMPYYHRVISVLWLEEEIEVEPIDYDGYPKIKES